jgi:hypothetical protein
MGGSVDDIHWRTRDPESVNAADIRRSAIMIIRTVIAQVLAASASVTAIALAPVAEAAPTGPSCTATGTATLCQSAGNAQFSATPPPVDYQAPYPFFGGYGLFFHHGGHHR